MRILIFLALLGTAFALPKSANRIVGGEATTIENYPYMANMQYGLWGIWWFQACGGSVLSSRLILSAAHCFDGDSPYDWRVQLGSSFASSGGSLHNVEQFVLHELYNTPSLSNDVAIVRLAVPAVFSQYIQPARIPGSNYNVPTGAVVTSIGWGTTSSGGSSPEQLHHVDVNVIDQELCAERYAYLKTQPGYQGWPDITDGMLCAGILDVGGKDACQGDSGGPLAFDKDVIIGVTSWGFGCADPTYPGVNARVSHYSDWIVANA